MNAITQQNNQAMLHDHYNQANHAFQQGDYAQALRELEQALQYADSDKQAAHIQQSIRTVTEMMPQEPSTPQMESQSPERGHDDTPQPGSNKMVLLTLLVGLICLTPIVMKAIEIFSQPSVQPTTQVESSAQPGTAETAAAQSATGAPASPASTPDVIVEAGATTWTVTGNGINLRETASTKGKSLARLSGGESVKMIEANAQQADSYIWSKVETSAGVTGWVASQFLKESAPVNVTPEVVAPDAATPDASATGVSSTEVSPVATGVTRKVASNGVSLRAQPGTKAVLITILSPSEVTVLEDKAAQADGHTWTKIKTSQGTEGWIADQFLSN